MSPRSSESSPAPERNARVPGTGAVLLVDDLLDTLTPHRRYLKANGLRVVEADSIGAAIGVLDAYDVRVVATDLKFPDGSGLQLVEHLRANRTRASVILMTAYPSQKSAASARELGVDEYLVKPVGPRALLDAIRRLSGKLQHDDLEAAQWGIVGSAAPMKRVVRNVRKYGPEEAGVLILGDNGTGKELVAKALHQESRRAAERFLALNCAGLSKELLENELFGHRRGAFTGADRDSEGLFMAADGGTVFLDEIGELPLELQPKLLRVLESGEIRRVGDSDMRSVNIRFLAATSRNLSREVERGTFRSDLYYRINVLRIDLPRLQDRGVDVFLLLRNPNYAWARPPRLALSCGGCRNACVGRGIGGL